MTEVFSTDNLFKYIFTLGAVMILMSKYYYHTSRDKYDEEIISLHQEHELIMFQMGIDESNDNELSEISVSEFRHDSLVLKLIQQIHPDTNIDNQFSALFKKQIDVHRDFLNRINGRRKLLLKQNHRNQLIDLKELQLKRITVLSNTGTIVGLLLVIIGSYLWWCANYTDEILKARLVSPRHKTPFIIITEYLKNRRRWLWIIAGLLIVIAVLLQAQIEYLDGLVKLMEQFLNHKH